MSAAPVPAASLAEPTLTERAGSVLLWGASLSLFLPFLPLMTLACAGLGLDASMPLQRFYSKWALRITGSKWRANVHPDVDPKRPYMFVHNHTNHFDFILMHNATPHYKRGIELEEHFRIPIYGSFMRTRGGIPVKRGMRGQSPEVLAGMRAALSDGHAILAFPEGHRTTDGRLGPFRKGVFFLARDLALPVVPVTVTGAFEMMRKGSPMMRPGHTLTCWVDRPIETEGMSNDDVIGLVDQVHTQMSDRIDDYWRERLVRMTQLDLGDGRSTRAAAMRQERRRAVLDASLRVFSERGYHATRISDLIDAAGIARGTFYLYFESKNAIFHELLDEMLDRVRTSVDGVDTRDGAAPLRMQLLTIVRGVLLAFHRRPELTRLILRSAPGLDEEVDRKLTAFYGALHAWLAQSLRNAQGLGWVRELDVDVVAWALLGSMKQLIERSIEEHVEGEALDRVAHAVLDVSLQGLLTTEAFPLE